MKRSFVAAKSLLLKFGLVSLISALVGACSNSGGSNTPAVVSNETDDVSCTYGFTQGDSSILGSSNIEKIQVANFAKEYNRSHFEAVAATSSKATVDFIESIGAKVVLSSIDLGRNCQNFSVLPAAPADIQADWDKSSGGVDKKARLAGLYLSKASEGLPSTTSSSFVVVTQDSDRWTLVHEMMHHLFQTRAISKGEPNLKALSKALNDNTDYLISVESQSGAVPALAALKTGELLDKALVRSALEEMAVEDLMSKTYQAGLFKNIPDSLSNAAWYLVSSGDKALKFYSDSTAYLNQKTFKDIQSVSDANLKLDLLSRYNSLIQTYSKRTEEIRSLRKQYIKLASSEKDFALDSNANKRRRKKPLPLKHHHSKNCTDNEAIQKASDFFSSRTKSN